MWAVVVHGLTTAGSDFRASEVARSQSAVVPILDVMVECSDPSAGRVVAALAHRAVGFGDWQSGATHRYRRGTGVARRRTGGTGPACGDSKVTVSAPPAVNS